MRRSILQNMHYMAMIAAAAVMAVSCTKDMETTSPQDGDSTGSIVFEACEKDMLQATRSGLDISDSAIKNVNFALYDYSTGKLDRVVYSSSSSSGEMDGLVFGRRYSIYALVNAGDMTSVIRSSYNTKSSIQNLTLQYTNASELKTRGVPMASDGSADFIYDGAQYVAVTVERLVAKYTFRMDKRLLDEGYVTVRELHLRQMAKTVHPFLQNIQGRYSTTAIDGDYADASDLTRINSGENVVFYALENRQGTLLPGNTDPWAKVPSNIPSGKDMCTYLEMICSYTSPSRESDNVTYRMYLGENATTNFDISRNTHYTLTFKPTDGGLDRTSWKIDPGDMTTWTTESELVVSPASASVKVGAAKQFTATYYTYTYANGDLIDTEYNDVTSLASWSSSRTAVATVSAGKATAKASGSATITATYEGYSASATLSVSDDVTYSYALKLSPASQTIDVGGTGTISAVYYTYTYTNGTLTNTATQSVTSSASWSSSSTSKATVSKGTVTGVSAGSATITATYSGKSATAAVTVRDVVTYGYELKLSPVSATVNVGATTSFSAVYYTYMYTNGVKTNTSSSVVTAAATWSSSSTARATVSSGTVTGKSAGTATITATYNGYTATATVTVKDVITYGYELKITPASATIYVGGTRAFTATYYTYTYTNGNLTNTSSSNVTSSASWSSSSTAVATVSSGTATGRSAGTATIKATWSGKSATASLTVQDYVETRYRIKLTPAETTVNEGGTVTYTVTRYSDTWTNGVLTSTGTSGTTIANSNCNWSVTAGSDCASVSSSGVATGTSMGTATIKAALKSDSTVYATAVLNVDYTINVNPGSGGTGSGGNKF